LNINNTFAVNLQ